MPLVSCCRDLQETKFISRVAPKIAVVRFVFPMVNVYSGNLLYLRKLRSHETTHTIKKHLLK